MAKTATKITPSATTPNTWASLIFQLYLALVCGFSLIVGIISGGSVLTNLVDRAYPPSIFVSETRWDDTLKADVPRSAAEIARDRTQQEVAQRENNSRDTLHSFIYLLLAAGVFGFHWRLFLARKG